MSELVTRAGYRRGLSPSEQRSPPIPFKANAARRHHIPKQRHRVTNWPAYDAALRQRGSLTVWFTEEAIAAWRAEPCTNPGRSTPLFCPRNQNGPELRAVFRLALRQTEGLISSIFQLLGLDLAVPDRSTLSRRAERLEVPKPSPSARETLFTCWSTAQACGSVGPVSGWSRSTALAQVDPGASCTSVLMLRPGRSSRRN
jgi:hypothetical protein